VALPSERWPRKWAPSKSFESLLAEANKELALLDSSLDYLRRHWDLRPSVAPVRGDSGPKAQVRAVLRRTVLSVLGRYLDDERKVTDHTVRMLEVLAKRVDELAALQLRVVGAVRADMLDLASHVDRELRGHDGAA
jgi:hypothetical protein